MESDARPHGGVGLRGLLALTLLALLLLAGIAAWSSSRSTEAGQRSSLITQQWLGQEEAELRPLQNSSMGFQVFFQRASYGNIAKGYNTISVENADLAMLLSTNASCIRIDIGYAPWLQKNGTAIREITALVQGIRAAGRCLVIADAASESYRGGGQLSWSEFKQAWVERVSTLASLYHPDYYIVVKEPGWYVPMVSDARTNPAFRNATDWLALTKRLAAAVALASPRSRVGVSVAADSLAKNPSMYVPYLTGVAKLPGIAFIGYDLYTTSGFNATQNFLGLHGSGGKDVWIAEAWSGDGPFIHDSSRAQLDKEWVLVLYYFAMHIHAVAMMPFYTDLFSSYGLSGTSPAVPAEIVSLYQERTPVFEEYRSIIFSAASGSSSRPSSAASLSTPSAGGRVFSPPLVLVTAENGDPAAAAAHQEGASRF